MSLGSQQELKEGVGCEREGEGYESSVGLESSSVNNTITIPTPKNYPENDIIKKLKVQLFGFLTLRLIVLQMIVRLSRFQLLILMVLRGLISIYLNGSISFEATKVTGITKSLGKLFCQEKLVDTVKVNMVFF